MLGSVLVVGLLLLRKSPSPAAIEAPVNQIQEAPTSDAASNPISETGTPFQDSAKAPPILVLTANNFEEIVHKCFAGEPCAFGEDPWVLYQSFKRSQHPRTCDSIIALMRKNLKDPAFREKYKDTLLAMIEDYYPPAEKDFQRAAYYDYLGDKEKSLALYLDLEKRAARDAVLRPAPKLNIANVYYDLHRLRESLPYYQAALQNLRNGPQVTPDQRQVMQFIQTRIDEIQEKLRRN